MEGGLIGASCTRLHSLNLLPSPGRGELRLATAEPGVRHSSKGVPKSANAFVSFLRLFTKLPSAVHLQPIPHSLQPSMQAVPGNPQANVESAQQAVFRELRAELFAWAGAEVLWCTQMGALI